MQKLLALIAISIILSQAYAQNSCGPGAATCSATSNSTYLTCLSGWYSNPLTGGNVGCSQCPSSAVTCSSGVNALTCTNGNQLLNGFCVPCSVSMTAACQSTCSVGGFVTSGASTCVSCLSSSSACATGCAAQGFYSSGNSCVQCPQGSSTCSSATLSTACTTGYYLASGGVCTACPTGQSSCSITPVAQSCSSGYYLTATSTCSQCQVDKSNACNSACLTAGYYSSGSTCNQCATSTSAACNAGCVSQGFLTTGTTDKPTCDACGTNALTCSSTSVALSCQNGYYLGKGGACSSCSTQTDLYANQVTCSPAPVPVACSFGYTKYRTTCVSCLSTTNKCNDDCITNQGYYSVNQTCNACQTGAVTCTNNTYSTKCNTGYILQGYNCVAVSVGTKTSGNPASSSSGCMDNYYYDSTDTSCKICANVGMKTCSDGGKTALTCMTGYADQYHGYCVACTDGASSCTLPNAVKCLSGYFLRAGVCTACNAQASNYVDTCNNENSGQHLGCKSGSYLSSGVCASCTNNAVQCISTSKHTQCSNNNFVKLPYTSTCTTTNYVQHGNALYQFEDSKSTLCSAGYYLSTDKATCTACAISVSNVAGCKSATAIDTCNEGYILDTNNVCVQCSGNPNSKKCSYTLYTPSSVTCRPGYYLNSLTSCDKCSSSTTLKIGTWDSNAQEASATITGSTIAILNQAQITACDVFQLTSTYASGAAQYNLLKSITCAAGYTPQGQGSIAVAASSGAGAMAYVAGTAGGLWGCYPCGTNVKTCAVTNQISSTASGLTPTGIVCSDGGYYLNSATSCDKCSTSTTLQIGSWDQNAAETGTTVTGIARSTNVPYNQAQITECDVFKIVTTNYLQSTTTAPSYSTLKSITCAAGYTPIGKGSIGIAASSGAGAMAFVANSAGGLWGCYPCGTNVKTCAIANSANYPTTGGTLTGSICNDGHYLNSATSCDKCSTSTTLQIGSWDQNAAETGTTVTGIARSTNVPYNQDKITECDVFKIVTTNYLQSTTTAPSYSTLKSITCAAGYTPKGKGTIALAASSGAGAMAFVANTAGGLWGCYPCGTNVKTCAIANSANYPTTGGTLTGSICNDGYYLNSASTCDKCSTSNTLKIGSWDQNAAETGTTVTGSQTVILNQAQIKECDVFKIATTNYIQSTTTAPSYTTLKSITCAAGYTPQGQGTIAPAASSGAGAMAFVANTAGGLWGCVPCNSDITGISSCVAGNSATSTSGAISSIQCSATYVLVANTQKCVSTTSVVANAADGITVNMQLTECKSQHYLRSSDKTCQACNSNIATCIDGTATKALSCNDNWLFIPSTTATDKSGTCVACGGNTLKCGMDQPYVSISNACKANYQMIQGQCFACPANSNGCTKKRPTDCRTGYYNNDGTCTPCTDASGAATCSTTGVSLTCNSNYYNSGTSPTVTCTSCGTGAASCTSTTKHTACIDGYSIFTGTTVCAACSAGGKTCTASTSSTLSSCLDGYYLNSAAHTCSACAGGVKTCTDGTAAAGTASDCLPGFYISSKNCYVCGMNVATCTDQNTPKTCTAGHSLVGTSCIICPSGASACSATNVATTCNQYYFLSLGQCIACPTGSTGCSSTMYATSCSDNYYLSSGLCVQCTTGAKTCDASGSKTALDGYFGTTSIVKCSDGSKTCSSLTVSILCLDGYSIVSPSTVCQKCTADNAKSCTTSLDKAVSCNDGYSVVSDKCVKCPSNAKSCTSTTAITDCNTGFAKSGDSTQCIPCLIGTNTCTAPIASSCQTGYQVNNGVCTQCASTTIPCISACSSNVGFVTVGQTCVACPTGATVCSSSSKATTCSAGYKPTVVSDNCVACGTGVATCSDTAVLTCQTTLGYIASTTSPVTCVSCGTGAKTCKSSTVATDCLDGYYLNQQGSCTQCQNTNAQTCEIKGTAVTCAVNYVQASGVCEACASTSSACVAGCLKLGFYNVALTVNNVTTTSCVSCGMVGTAQCSSTTVGQSCFDGYYLNEKAVCTVCSNNVATCKQQLNVVAKTDSCTLGFYNDQNGKCQPCGANFATCNNSTVGLTCLTGHYYVDSKTCTACPSPASRCTSATAFQACLDTFYPTSVSGQDVSCQPCGTANNVVNCYNATWALTCSVGFSPVNGSCTQCPSNAQSCTGSLINQCKTGYYIVNQYFANNTCNACGAGAATCSSNTTALTCLSGFGLSSSGACVKCGTGASSCTISGSSTTATACYASFQNVTNGACSCAAGQAPSADGSSCVQCPANCAVCSSSTQCTTCNSPYAVSSSGACAPNCATNQYFGAAAANSTSKRILQSCQNCPSTCSACSSATSCTNCTQGNSLKSDNSCAPSIARKLSLGNIFMMFALFLGLALISKQ